MKNGDMPANPVFNIDGHTVYVQGDNFLSEASGLTKREAFAMAAMQGILSNINCYPTEQWHFDNIATDATRAADALLKELDKE